jgi:hypothetical protein
MGARYRPDFASLLNAATAFGLLITRERGPRASQRKPPRAKTISGIDPSRLASAALM